MATLGMAGPRKNGMATAGMICGIIGIVLCWFPFLGLIAGLLGIVFGAIGMSRAGRLGNVGKGAAITGLVCGIMSFFMTGVMAAVAIPAFLEYMNKGKKTEANLQLRSIETKVKTFRIEKGRTPIDGAVMPAAVSAANCTGIPKALQSAWVGGWLEMGFHIDEDSRYGYTWAQGAGTATATGDLDCDGTPTSQVLTLTLSQGNLVASYADPTPD